MRQNNCNLPSQMDVCANPLINKDAKFLDALEDVFESNEISDIFKPHIKKIKSAFYEAQKSVKKCITTSGTKYSRMDQVNFLKGCLPQILLGLLLNTLSQMLLILPLCKKMKRTSDILQSIKIDLFFKGIVK